MCRFWVKLHVAGEIQKSRIVGNIADKIPGDVLPDVVIAEEIPNKHVSQIRFRKRAQSTPQDITSTSQLRFSEGARHDARAKRIQSRERNAYMLFIYVEGSTKVAWHINKIAKYKWWNYISVYLRINIATDAREDIFETLFNKDTSAELLDQTFL